MTCGLIIPCYNFADGLERTLRRVDAWHETGGKDFHVLFVDDGSTDATHRMLVEFQRARESWLQVRRNPRNLGKGASIRAGFQQLGAFCDRIFFTDCDLHYGLSILNERMAPLLEHNDIVIADRSWVASSNHEAVSRQMSSYIFNRLMGLFTGVTLRDSQAGCKGFRTRECAPLFELMRIEGFAFDVEILSIALFYRLRIAQVPVRFENEHQFPGDSSVKLLRTSLKMFQDLVRINLRWKRGHYRHPEMGTRIDAQVYLVRDEAAR